MPKKNGELTDKEKFGVWEKRTENEGLFGSVTQSLALFGTLSPPDSAKAGKREVREWPGEYGFWDRFKLT